MRIALDAMGGDHAPLEILKGAALALESDQQLQIILVGNEKTIHENMHAINLNDSKRVSIVHCEEVIEMDDHPATAYRKKKNASITVATRLVKDKSADAVVSAGSTGGQMVAALFVLGRIQGVERPAIVIDLPTLGGNKILLDGGANSDSRPQHLQQFARMGSVYATQINGAEKPEVALINIGAEETKGNELTTSTYKLLKEDNKIIFTGNIEGREVMAGKADVMICDGFVGNVILKVIEGTSSALFTLLKQEFTNGIKSKIGAFLLRPRLIELKKRLDYAERGGAPLLGVDGISIICHGSSKSLAIKNAIEMAKTCKKNDLIKRLTDSIKSD